MTAPDRDVDLPCVVLGGGITALGVVRSLGRAGLELYIVCRRGDVAARSRWVRRCFEDIVESDDPAALERALVERGIPRAVLFPCSDTWAQAVAGMSAESRTRYPASISGREVLELLVDKARFYETLDRVRIPHPQTRRVTGVAEIEQSDLSGHFLKPSNSQKFSAVFSDKAIRFTTRDEAAAGLQHMASAGVEALLQEYVPGPPDNHYFVDGYLDREGVVRAVFVRRRTRMFPVSFGNSSHMMSVPLHAAQQAADDTLRLLTEIGFRGAFSAELKQDPRDGEFKLLEVNGRPWWYIGFAADCGVDVTLLSYRDALGLELETTETYRTGVRCVLLHLDIRAYLYERRRSGLSFPVWLRSVVGARSAVFSWDDPGPGLVLFAGMLKSSVRKSLPRASGRRGRGA